MSQAFLPERVLLAHGFAAQRAVLVERGRIVDVVAADDARVAAAERVMLPGLSLAPGFIRDKRVASIRLCVLSVRGQCSVT